jgi:hypothetical protein
MLLATRPDTHRPGGAGTAAAEATRPEADRQVLALLDQFLEAHHDDALAWVACSPVWADYKVNSGTDARRRGRTVASAGRVPLNVLRSLVWAGQVGGRYLIPGDAIVAANTTNQQRAVAPLLSTDEDTPRAPLLAPSAPSVRLAVTAQHRATEISDGLRRAEVAFPGGSRGVLGLFLSAAWHLAYSRRLIERLSPSVVVVASNHDVVTRALVRAAHEHGVPSVLVPHAPMLGDARLRDAPTDYVAVRGDREAAWYLASGVEANQVAVVGNASLQPEPGLVSIPTNSPVVFAPSPYSDAVVANQVALIAAATDGAVVVTPHPRQRLAFLHGVVPPHWTFHSGQTYARLRGGAAAVVQSSSGVALESLLLGIPVVELEAAGGRLYPFLESELVPSARTPEELSGHLELMRARVADHAYRTRLVDYARGWCAAGGETAAQNVRRFVRFAVAHGKRSRPAHDAWRPSETESA